MLGRALCAPCAARYALYRQFTLQNGKHLTKGKRRSWEQGVESKIEGLIEVLREDEGRILEICRSGKMTMRRCHHIFSVLKAMGAGPSESPRARGARGCLRRHRRWRAGMAED